MLPATSPILRNFRQEKRLIRLVAGYLFSHGYPVEKINRAVRGKGAAHLATSISGKVLHIQMLPANALQDPDQWKYQKLVEQAGDIYQLVRTFSDFHEAYCLITRRKNIDYTKPAKDENEAVQIMTGCQLPADLKAFYLTNATLINASVRATNCYKARRAIIPFKLRQHG